MPTEIRGAIFPWSNRRKKCRNLPRRFFERAWKILLQHLFFETDNRDIRNSKIDDDEKQDPVGIAKQKKSDSNQQTAEIERISQKAIRASGCQNFFLFQMS